MDPPLLSTISFDEKQSVLMKRKRLHSYIRHHDLNWPPLVP
ncbi:hypothetical protein [Coxiella burnetii]